MKDNYFRNNKNNLIFNSKMSNNKKFSNKNNQIKIPNNNNYKSLKEKLVLKQLKT